jgi:hypothetical protein
MPATRAVRCKRAAIWQDLSHRPKSPGTKSQKPNHMEPSRRSTPEKRGRQLGIKMLFFRCISTSCKNTSLQFRPSFIIRPYNTRHQPIPTPIFVQTQPQRLNSRHPHPQFLCQINTPASYSYRYIALDSGPRYIADTLLPLRPALTATIIASHILVLTVFFEDDTAQDATFEELDDEAADV